MYPPKTCDPKPAVAASLVANILPSRAFRNSSVVHLFKFPPHSFNLLNLGCGLYMSV